MRRVAIRVRSKAEKIIADFLTVEGFHFLYEPWLPVGGHFLRPDFYFTDMPLPYEHFGLDTPHYLHRAERKIAHYVKAGLPFIYTTFNDETDIEDVLTDKLAEFQYSSENF